MGQRTVRRDINDRTVAIQSEYASVMGISGDSQPISIEKNAAMALRVHTDRGKKSAFCLRHGQHDAFKIIFMLVEPDFSVVPRMIKIITHEIICFGFLNRPIDHRQKGSIGHMLPIILSGHISVKINSGNEIPFAGGRNQHVHRGMNLRGVVRGDLQGSEDTISHCFCIGKLDPLRNAPPRGRPPSVEKRFPDEE